MNSPIKAPTFSIGIRSLICDMVSCRGAVPVETLPISLGASIETLPHKSLSHVALHTGKEYIVACQANPALVKIGLMLAPFFFNFKG